MENIKKIEKFHDLVAWQEAHKLVLEIYRLTDNFPKSELFGLTSQMRRAASSVTANIAEGFSRYYFNDKIRFYYHSRGSVSEVQNFLLLAKDLGYIDLKNYEKLDKIANEVGQLINGLIRSISNQQK